MMFEKYQLTKPDNIVDLFENSVKKFPDRPCLGTKNKQGEYEWVTYREMGCRIDNLRGGLVARDDVQKMISNDIIDTLKKKYGGYEIPRKFIYLTEPFTLENGMMTQTMKLKRRVIMEKYKDKIEALYKK